LIYNDDFSTVENMRVGTVPMNWDRLVVRQHELAMTQAYDLNDEWK